MASSASADNMLNSVIEPRIYRATSFCSDSLRLLR